MDTGLIFGIVVGVVGTIMTQKIITSFKKRKDVPPVKNTGVNSGGSGGNNHEL